MGGDYALESWLQREGIPDVDVLMAFEKAGVPYVEVSGMTWPAQRWNSTIRLANRRSDLN